ncbi:Cof-type HAD-IIB family hydrolase [Ornithinibacillus bavariensis]|uniref:Cof-type HAD-IIB family hydrolase n=1 Tax=Ornithinibacillus bavariensis TaxID=545502 RepID=A0A920C7V8_9BACI|nr:Cof-type HAD-IIB family hydrolase [Ornithinibacillus bavariensis]GIO27072.1 Cof-type HAD-IIB family hydrolase [Ornithinibacillus bavariensis]
MKLIATDMDGTLLNEYGKISEENCTAIKHALNKGVQVVVATGRSYEAAYKPLQEVGLNLPIISLNGANIHDLHENLLQSTPMDPTSCLSIQQACHNENMYFEVFTNKGIFSVSRGHFRDVLVDIMVTAHPTFTKEEIQIAVEQRFQDERVKFTEDYHTLFHDPAIEVYKILAFSLDEAALNRVKQSLRDQNQIAITSSGSINLEFNHVHAQKGIALKFFADSLKINMKDVVAFGDNYNDLSMLLDAGIGIAMENAEEDIKKQCDMVTKKNTEHGVGYAIEKLLSESD